MSTPSKDSEGTVVPDNTLAVTSIASPSKAPHVVEDSKKLQVSLRLLQWFIFTVAVAVLPLGINALRIAVKPNLGETLSLSSLVAGHGELALVCAAITADAVGDIFMSRQTRSFAILIAFGTCFLIFFLSASVFVIAQSVTNNSNLDLVANCSYALFIFTLASGLSCKYYAIEA